jgi:hypothetical protein
MDSVALIVAALTTGAAAAADGAAPDIAKNGYAQLKALLVRKFAGRPELMNAVAQVERKPISENRRNALKEELQAAGASEDDELLQQAKLFLDLLEKNGIRTDVTYVATNLGSGAIAQGQGAVAAGAGGIAVSGNVEGGIIIGNNNQVTTYTDGVDTSG